MLTSVNTSNLSTKRNMTNINHLIEDEVRDDECVVIESTEIRKGGEDNTLRPCNTINMENGNICLNFNRVIVFSIYYSNIGGIRMGT